jgi:hypothetical protein
MEIVVTAALLGVGAALFYWLAPWVQGSLTLAQFVVAKLHRRAQRAMYLAHAADTALVAYCEAESADKSCPKSLWMEVCQR